jgi:hypothetical protein
MWRLRVFATAVPAFVGTELGVLNGHDVPELSVLQVLPRGVEVVVSPSPWVKCTQVCGQCH